MSLRVVQPGLHSLIVDFGRPGSRCLGVPMGGAADRSALSIGNALVGNPPDSPALEISLAGPTLEANCDVACVVNGAPFTVRTDRSELTAGITFNLLAGERLTIGAAEHGMRAYLCVRGGFQRKPILASCSALAPLQAGAELVCAPGAIPARFVRHSWAWNREPRVLRILDGAQTNWFASRDFIDQDYTVAPASNRMGLRLSSKPLRVPDRELVSEPVCPGAVQVTRDGQCIILGMDGQTIGGYPKIAQVITADVDKLAQLRPGETIRFERVTLEEAEAVHREKQAEITEWVTRLRASV